VKGKSLPIQDEPEELGQLVYDWDMRLIMNDRNLQTIELVRQFLEGSETLEFRALSVGEKYDWIEEVMIRFSYHRLKRLALAASRKNQSMKINHNPLSHR